LSDFFNCGSADMLKNEFKICVNISIENDYKTDSFLMN